MLTSPNFKMTSKNRLSSFFKFKDSVPLCLCTTLLTNFSGVISILLTMAKLNVILKLRKHISTSPLTGKS